MKQLRTSQGQRSAISSPNLLLANHGNKYTVHRLHVNNLERDKEEEESSKRYVVELWALCDPNGPVKVKIVYTEQKNTSNLTAFKAISIVLQNY